MVTNQILTNMFVSQIVLQATNEVNKHMEFILVIGGKPSMPKLKQ